MKFKLYALFIGVLVMAFLFGMPAAAIPSCPPGEEWGLITPAHWGEWGECQDCPSEEVCDGYETVCDEYTTICDVSHQECISHHHELQRQYKSWGYSNHGQCTSECVQDNHGQWCAFHCNDWVWVEVCDEYITVCDQSHEECIASHEECTGYSTVYSCHEGDDYQSCGENQEQYREWIPDEYGCIPVSCPAIPCETGYECIDNQCVLEDPCADVQCLPGEVCEQGECVPVTCPAIPCDPGYYCDQGQCIPDGTCPVVPCPPGYHCIEGGCIEDICGEDFQCRPGYYCQDNECVIIPTGPSPFTDSFWSTTNGICWSLTEHGEIHLTVKDDEKFYVEVLSETILDGAAVFIHPGEEALCNSDATRVYYRPGCSEERQSGNYLVFSLSGTRAFQVNVIKEDGFDPRTVYVRVRNVKGDILYEDSFSGKSYEQTFSLVMDGSQCRLHGRTNWHIPEDMYRDGFFPYPY